MSLSKHIHTICTLEEQIKLIPHAHSSPVTMWWGFWPKITAFIIFNVFLWHKTFRFKQRHIHAVTARSGQFSNWFIFVLRWTSMHLCSPQLNPMSSECSFWSFLESQKDKTLVVVLVGIRNSWCFKSFKRGWIWTKTSQRNDCVHPPVTLFYTKSIYRIAFVQFAQFV